MRFGLKTSRFLVFALLVCYAAVVPSDAAEALPAGDAAASLSNVVAGQEGGQQPAPRHPAEVLPAPLENVACNLAGLEESGHLVLSKPRLGRSEDFGDEALIWTVKVQRPISCRHATILLRQFSDVRFYFTEEYDYKELYSTDLLYSLRVSQGAVHGEILGQDEEFEIWILLSLRHADMLVFLQADKVLFKEPQTVRVRPLSAKATRWNAASSNIPRWFSKRQDPQRLP